MFSNISIIFVWYHAVYKTCFFISLLSPILTLEAKIANLSFLMFCFVSFCSVRDWVQGLVHAKQVLYHGIVL